MVNQTSQEMEFNVLFCTATNANNVSRTNSRHINAGKLRKGRGTEKLQMKEELRINPSTNFWSQDGLV